MRKNDSNSPVACTLDEDQAAKRVQHIRRNLVPRYINFTSHDTGLTLRFTGIDETLPAIARFVSEELQCCSFANYQITVNPPYDETRLTITGPDGTKELFEDGFASRLAEETE